MKNNKSQVTMFVIIGIGLFMAISFLLFASIFIQKVRLRTEIARQIDLSLKESGVEKYVDECIYRVTMNGIRLAMIQGGRIYDYQGGIDDSTYLKRNNLIIDINVSKIIGKNLTNVSGYNNDTFNISIIVDNDTSFIIKYVNKSVNPENLLIPNYPWPETKISELKNKFLSLNSSFEKSRKEYYSGFLGYNILNPLCNLEGRNAYFNPPSCYYPLKDMIAAELYSNSSDSRIKNVFLEESLSKYIESHIGECADLSIFKNISGLNFTNPDKPRVEIEISQKNTEVKLYYDFNIKYGKRGLSIEHLFKKKIGLSIPRIFGILETIAREESQNPLFEKEITDPENMGEDIKSIDNNIKDVFITPIRVGEDYLTIYVVEYSYHNKSIFLSGLVKNRHPVLDYINEEKCGENINLCIRENDTLMIDPFGVDPDGLQVEYNYSEWKETIDEYFNFECCMEYGGTVNCSNLSEIRKCIVRIPGEPHNWTHSREFEKTGRRANYTTNRNDTGIHYLIVSVKDPTGLIDYQNVTILVYDLPVANFTARSIYIDIHDNWGSIEDPFILNGSLSRTGVIGDGKITLFLWNDTYEPFNISYSEPYLYIPEMSETAPSYTNIINIKDLNFTKTGYHTITLKVEESSSWGVTQSIKDIKVINITKCLPHRSYYPAFPYYEGEGPYGEFLGNHTCCLDTGELASQDAICYKKEGYGSLISINNTVNKLRKNPNSNLYHSDHYYPLEGGLLEDYEGNDIYYLSFSRHCDGERGNICGGEMWVSITPRNVCNDNPSKPRYLHERVEERCSGPPINQLGIDSEINEEIFSCVNYDTKSFEDIVGLDNNEGCWEGNVCDGDILVKRLGCEDGGCEKVLESVNCNLESECKIDPINGNVYYYEGKCQRGECIKEKKDPDNKKEYCENILPEGCNGFNGREWHYFEEFPSWKSYCCGDDENEYYTKSNIGDEEYVRCCEENNMCVDPDSNCIEEGIIIDYNGLNYNCSCNEVGCNWVEVEIE